MPFFLSVKFLAEVSISVSGNHKFTFPSITMIRLTTYIHIIKKAPRGLVQFLSHHGNSPNIGLEKHTLLLKP